MIKKFLSILKDEKGFTLMEAIISIAALAVVSGFILQMFLVASNVNVRASEIDKGNSIVFSEIELMKKEKSVDIYLKDSLVTGSDVKQTDTGYNLQKYFDKDFKQISKTEFETYTESGEKYFVLQFVFDEIEKQDAGVLYGTNASITKHETAIVDKVKEVSAKEIVKISANKYFVN